MKPLPDARGDTTSNTLASEPLAVPGAPAITGLVFRPFRGESDYAAMIRLANERAAVNGDDWNLTVAELAADFAPTARFDPTADALLAEVEGTLVGFWRGNWWEENDGPLIYGLQHFLHPDWRGQGLGRAALQWLEQRMRAIAATHDPARPKILQGYASHGNRYQAGLLEANGYQAVRHFHLMVRPALDDIPDFPLPEGLEVRPVRPEHWRALWDADVEAFRDAWGMRDPDEAEYQSWLDNKIWFQPELWQVAWDAATGAVAGQVRTYIDHGENERFGRLRGYTEFISVRRPYRRRGLARALIARSLRAQRDAGMTASALHVDAESLTGAPRVYEDCGFRVQTTDTLYRKAL
ncbi:MAG: GNAT family N-acetyltransferase [Candidatus Promineofilum sp.]|nr:GNAT family N-acetyltransferase [Promineifilum sp.]MCW5864892.1 GNAT family N-acetyltransferase [Anaerolineae bacterium]